MSKNLFYNAHHSFIKFKNITDFKELSLDSMYKKLSDFYKKINEFKNFVPQKKGNEDLKTKVLDSDGEIVLFSVYRIIFTRKNITNKKMIQTKKITNFWLIKKKWVWTGNYFKITSIFKGLVKC